MRLQLTGMSGPIAWTTVVYLVSKLENMARQGGLGVGRFRCW